MGRDRHISDLIFVAVKSTEQESDREALLTNALADVI